MINFLKYVVPSIFVLIGLTDLILGAVTNGVYGGVVPGAIIVLAGIGLFVVMPITTRRD
jgi:hypothetical protein